MTVPELKQARRKSNLWLLGWFTVIFFLWRLSQNFMRMIEYGQWGPPRIRTIKTFDESGRMKLVEEPEFTDVPDLGIAILQPLFVSLVYVMAAGLFATIMATIVERQFREDAFGTSSRFGRLWLAFFAGVLFVSGSIL